MAGAKLIHLTEFALVSTHVESEDVMFMSSLPSVFLASKIQILINLKTAAPQSSDDLAATTGKNGHHCIYSRGQRHLGGIRQGRVMPKAILWWVLPKAGCCLPYPAETENKRGRKNSVL